MGTEVRMQAYGFSAAARLLQCCGHAASSLQLAVPSASGVMLILTVLQPPLSSQVSDGDVVRKV